MSVDVMQHLMPRVKEKALRAPGEADRFMCLFCGLHFAASCALSLRGPEGLLMDLGALAKHLPRHADCTAVPLLGRVKGEHGERQHLLPSVNVTSSGTNLRFWVETAVSLHLARGQTRGPAVSDVDRKVLSTKELDTFLHEVLGDIYDDHPSLFAADVTSIADTQDKCDASRSFRRGSDSRAVAQKVSEDDIDVVNCWKKKERAGAARPAHKMRQHCADVTLLLPSFLRCTKAM